MLHNCTFVSIIRCHVCTFASIVATNPYQGPTHLSVLLQYKHWARKLALTAKTSEKAALAEHQQTHWRS